MKSLGGFGLLVVQKKPFENITLASGEISLRIHNKSIIIRQT